MTMHIKNPVALHKFLLPPTMMRKCIAFHNLDSLVEAGATTQALETKIENERRTQRRLSEESFASSATNSSSKGHTQAFDLNYRHVALNDLFQTFLLSLGISSKMINEINALESSHVDDT